MSTASTAAVKRSRVRKFSPVVVTNGPLTADEARDLTVRIRQQVQSLWMLVTEAHDRKAWQAMGYDSWAAYVRAELQMSQARAYQLVDTGHVARAAQQVLADVQGDQVSNVLEIAPTAREAARAKNQLPALRRQFRTVITKEGMEPRAALKEAIKRLPQPEPPTIPKQRKPKPQKRLPRGTKTCPRCDGLGYI